MDSGAGTQSAESIRQKRSRIVLSCGPCRASKLKCDRESPCGQCRKKEREDLCQYAPKPEKRKPERRNRNMAERLKRLEGMVRGMMDENDGSIIPPPGQQRLHRQSTQASGTAKSSVSASVTGQVVGGHDAGTYVGATHCMAMLEDIEDLKCYFEDYETHEEEDLQGEDMEMPDMLFSRKTPGNKSELIAQLPERKVADRLVTRYFGSMCPSQHIVHRPTFTKEYAAFWQNPEASSFHWLASLFMMVSMGTHYNSFLAPGEVETDSPVPPKDRMRHWKSCAAWALVWGKYNHPTMSTLQAMILYVESDFILNRAAQMDCYILSSVMMRLMFKMGLHREPGKLANISAFEGEMRRRMWNMALQVESLVSFHMGLPSMVYGVVSDTEVPRNLHDADFDENTAELPPGRPNSDWTSMTYPIQKTNIIRVFRCIAAQAHALTPPTYAEVLRLDTELEYVWDRMPEFMKIQSLSECVGDPSNMIIQRFGLSALRSKCVCVLHRRFLVEAVPQPQHNYSRQQCLEAATQLLTNQQTIWEASRPGHVLSDQGWFLTSLAIHDYLLAAMVLYLVIQNEHYENPASEHNWTSRQQPAPSKGELKNMIKTSQEIWSHVADSVGELRKTAQTLTIMLARLDSPADQQAPLKTPSIQSTSMSPAPHAGNPGHFSAASTSTGGGAPLGTDFESNSERLSSMNFSGFDADINHFTMPQPTSASNATAFPHAGAESNLNMESLDLEQSWMFPSTNVDWRFMDISMAHSGSNLGPGPVWTERPSMGDVDLSLPNFWGSSMDGQGSPKQP